MCIYNKISVQMCKHKRFEDRTRENEMEKNGQIYCAHFVLTIKIPNNFINDCEHDEHEHDYSAWEKFRMNKDVRLLTIVSMFYVQKQTYNTQKYTTVIVILFFKLQHFILIRNGSYFSILSVANVHSQIYTPISMLNIEHFAPPYFSHCEFNS